MIATHKTRVSALVGALFLALGLALTVIGVNFKDTEANYWLGFIGLGLLLESFYLATHFLLKVFVRPEIALTYSRIMAALFALPLTTISVMLGIVGCGAVSATDNDAIPVMVFLALLSITVGMPTFLLWRHAIGLLKRFL